MTARKAPLETSESQMFAWWLQRRGHWYCHVPNEGKRSPQAAARLKREGMIPGAPDFLVFVAGDHGHGVAVEMKRQPPSFTGPTPSQRKFLAKLTEAGWATYVAKGAEDAIEFCQRLGL